MSRFEPSSAYVEPYGALLEQRRVEEVFAKDGTRLSYEVVGEGGDVIILANGLGGRLYAWLPVVQAFKDRYRVITWDYRGLFDSEAPASARHLSVRDHAEDLLTVLDAEGVETAHFVGWSMGVQVALEAHTLAPHRTRSLSLINGSFGQVFSSAFQPLIKVALVPPALHALLEALSDRPGVARFFMKGGHVGARGLFAVRRALLPRVHSHFSLGLRQYASDLVRTDPVHYLRLFQQIDAHSVYHLLPQVSAPTLVISGGLDFLTPADQSRAMARRIPGAKHKFFPLASHFAVLERPKKVVKLLTEHLLGR